MPTTRYQLYYNNGGGTFQLRFGDEITGELAHTATAAAIDAALEALDGITEADVTVADTPSAERGSWELTITADAGHPLQVLDGAFTGNLQLNYIGELTSPPAETDQPADEGDGGTVEPEAEAEPEPEPEPETWLERQVRLANDPFISLTNVDAGELDAHDLTLPEDASGSYSARYQLYYNDGGGMFQLRFGDETTGELAHTATAAAIGAALEALDGVTEADVTVVGTPSAERGSWELTITADAGHPLQVLDGDFTGNLQLNYIGALTGALTPPPAETGQPADEGDGGTAEVEPEPETWLEQQLQLANDPLAYDGGQAQQAALNAGQLTNVGVGELDAHDLTLPADASGSYSARYHLYYNNGGGTFQLRFDDEITVALAYTATAAAIDAALEALDGITEADVTVVVTPSAETGTWELSITADAGHPLQVLDGDFTGNLGLNYIGA